MSTPRDFRPIRLRHVDERHGRRVIRDIKAWEAGEGIRRERSRYAWVGPAAETALVNAFTRAPHKQHANLANTRRYDIYLEHPDGIKLRCEVKTRIAEAGWVHPERFDWISVPMHENREPVKEDVDIIFFCWWSADAPRCLWLVGMLRGLEAFTHAATFYKHGELLPRGGYVEGQGTYQLHVNSLFPVPRGLFREWWDA